MSPPAWGEGRGRSAPDSCHLFLGRAEMPGTGAVLAALGAEFSRVRSVHSVGQALPPLSPGMTVCPRPLPQPLEASGLQWRGALCFIRRGPASICERGRPVLQQEGAWWAHRPRLTLRLRRRDPHGEASRSESRATDGAPGARRRGGGPVQEAEEAPGRARPVRCRPRHHLPDPRPAPARAL